MKNLEPIFPWDIEIGDEIFYDEDPYFNSRTPNLGSILVGKIQSCYKDMECMGDCHGFCFHDKHLNKLVCVWEARGFYKTREETKVNKVTEIL